MSVVFQSPQAHASQNRLPLVAREDPSATLAWCGGRPVSVAGFLGDVEAVGAILPDDAVAAVNLCEDRYAFLVSFCALVRAGHSNLLPPSRAPLAVAEVMAAHPHCYAVGDRQLYPPPPGYRRLPELTHRPATASTEILLDPAQVVAIGYTSGSTGCPRGHTKTWGSFNASTALNHALLRSHAGEQAHIVATVPPQHMYGMEMSILLPLLSRFSVHAGRPFFAADVAQALHAIPAPRLLVTTPVHLRTLLHSDQTLPPLAAIVSATAPLPQALAAEAEAGLGAPVQEVFGSTETCVIAHRRCARDQDWTLYPPVNLRPQPDGTLVEASYLPRPVALADLVELVPGHRFRLCGRNTDLLEVAGKRASLSDLTQRLLAVPGVRDAVVFQLADQDAAGVRRIAALVVAPGGCARQIQDTLRRSVDPVFLPRPLKLVPALPRNETGKLPRRDLLALLRSGPGEGCSGQG